MAPISFWPKKPQTKFDTLLGPKWLKSVKMAPKRHQKGLINIKKTA
jgi:hypothetical protein